MRIHFTHSWLKRGLGLLAVAALLGSGITVAVADEIMTTDIYDEAAYTEYVETTMKQLDKLYLDFCDTCGVEGSKAAAARQDFLVQVRDLMKHMNARFDSLDPKKGAALSPTETLVSVHALTMLVDILAATEMEHAAMHPFNE